MDHDNFDKYVKSILEDIESVSSVYGNDGAYDTTDARNFFPNEKKKKKKSHPKIHRRKMCREL